MTVKFRRVTDDEGLVVSICVCDMLTVVAVLEIGCEGVRGRVNVCVNEVEGLNGEIERVPNVAVFEALRMDEKETETVSVMVTV